MAWATTFTGKQVHYLEPSPDEIDIVDIITSLSRNHRFGGFSPLKITQHILEVASSMAREVREGGGSVQEQATAFLVGLLHDFPEYILLDVPTPMKRVLGTVYSQMEDCILECMLDKWGLAYDYALLEPMMKKHDSIAVHSEAIRYKMDGFVYDPATETHLPAVRRWVPEDAIQPFSEDVYNENQVSDMLAYRFVQCMVLTGRADLLPDWIKEEMKQYDVSVVNISEYDEMPSFFADGYPVLINP